MSEFGVDRFTKDLASLGYKDIEVIKDVKNLHYIILKNYEIDSGRFINNCIQLGIPVPNDYPRSLMASIHIMSNPILLDIGSSKGKYNVIKSTLGDGWRYWSNRFSADGKEPTLHIMAQINGIFRNI